ncbi:MAG: LysR family transcriptional regulator [Proteobacteria bacterium]|nr:LysR family transcriptional regulator [Pseudomonadota bacterium]
MDRISDLAVFVAVIEQGSFTAAAEHLALSKAAVSKYVSRLEKRLGARLMNRTTRRLTLTEAGQALFDRASVAIADLEAAESDVVALTGTPRGRLRMTVPTHFGEVFLAPLLAGFRQRYPDVELDLDLDNRIVDLVQEGFDLGIRITQLGPSSLVARKLAEVRMVTVASPVYFAARGTPATPSELREHECLIYGLDRTPGEWRFRRGLDRLISVHVHGNFRCNNDGTLKRAALDGMGILRFPELFVEKELREGTLVAVLEEFEMQTLALSAVFPTRRNLAPKVRVFVDYLAEQFRKT